MSGEPTLARDRQNDPNWVVYLQERLAAEGYDPGPIDGIFGPRTEAAVESYQYDRGLQVDGIVGRQTWASLQGEEPQSPGDSGDWGWDHGGGGGGGWEPGGDGDGSVDAVISSELAVDGSLIWFGVTNTGERIWAAGEVIYDLIVVSQETGVATQVVNDQIQGVSPGNDQGVGHTLATERDGAYSAIVSLTVLGEPKGASTLDFILGELTVPETGGA